MMREILGEWTFQVEAGKMVEFARAVGQAGDIDHKVAAPTFPVVASAGFVSRLANEILALAPDRTVHGEHSYEYFEPIRAGDLISCRAEKTSDKILQGKRGGKMRMITVETEYRRVSDEKLLCKEVMKVIERGTVT